MSSKRKADDNGGGSSTASSSLQLDLTKKKVRLPPKPLCKCPPFCSFFFALISPAPSSHHHTGKTKPDTIAATLLLLLPDGATTNSEEARKLLRGFRLCQSVLSARANAAERTGGGGGGESSGIGQPLRFSLRPGGKKSLPEETFAHVLRFLGGREMTHTVGVVCKLWLAKTRLPGLWRRIDRDSGMANSSKRMTMKSFLKVLERPQFAQVRYLSLPSYCKLGKTTMKQISKACPFLTTLNIGYTGYLSGSSMREQHLLDAAEHMMNLSSIRFGGYISSTGVENLVKEMRGQLVDLRIKGRSVHDDSLSIIGETCANLRYFAYIGSNSDFTGKGVLALLEGCKKLEVLELEQAKGVTKDDIQTIVHLANKKGNGKFDCLKKVDLWGYPFVVEGKKKLRIKDLRTGERRVRLRND
ncbi:hypothetical protein THAOC_21256 [Thalassiosira oceanica]|uniref:F-box domain-containing protein n=1 Tax=Thalassiosira oceanica TaxID=159749 RepID=K0SJG7_THAOC|nr:hypothetical protein THAOC_21256 [Thalassiosira oceanica]|eukprot:EJK58607.1 hypothetical protein THAOC_21256 [Thalassiosira oceanica]